MKYAFDSKSKIIKMKELIMLCPKCGKEMKKGYLFASKDGAFSFAEKVPGAFENARNAEGVVQITELKAGHRTSAAANCCEDCRMVVLNY